MLMRTDFFNLERHFALVSNATSSSEIHAKTACCADLHGILVFVDSVLGSHVIVGSPVKVEFPQIVVVRQSTEIDAMQTRVVQKLNLNCSHQIITYTPLLTSNLQLPKQCSTGTICDHCIQSYNN